MATNIIGEGKIIENTNAGGAIHSGDIVNVGNLLGVALTDIAASTGKGSVQILGCVVKDVPKDTSTFVKGEATALYWDGTQLSNVLTSATLTTNVALHAAAATGVAVCNIILK